jgi:hypothetical protein
MALTHLTKPKADMTLDDWASVLSRSGKRTSDEIPTGFDTIKQICKQTNKSETQVRLEIREAQILGLVERQKFKIWTGDKLYPTTHYRIIGKYENDACRKKTQK